VCDLKQFAVLSCTLEAWNHRWYDGGGKRAAWQRLTPQREHGGPRTTAGPEIPQKNGFSKPKCPNSFSGHPNRTQGVPTVPRPPPIQWIQYTSIDSRHTFFLRRQTSIFECGPNPSSRSFVLCLEKIGEPTQVNGEIASGCFVAGACREAWRERASG
jgi:hypothetical protein